jgi:hypothetical protein
MCWQLIRLQNELEVYLNMVNSIEVYKEYSRLRKERGLDMLVQLH